MKEYIFILLLLLSFSATQAQFSVADGMNIGVLATDDLSVMDNLQNNGTIERVTLSGTTTQSVSGTGTINHLKLFKTSGTATIVSDMQSITGTLELTSGTLAAAGKLTLKSTASGTARVAQHSPSTGNVTGNVVVERWINSASGTRARQWRLLGFPYNAAMPLTAISGMSIDYTTNLSMMYFNESGADATTGSSTAPGSTTEACRKFCSAGSCRRPL